MKINHILNKSSTRIVNLTSLSQLFPQITQCTDDYISNDIESLLRYRSVVVGSHAVKRHFDDARVPNDLDVYTTVEFDILLKTLEAKYRKSPLTWSVKGTSGFKLKLYNTCIELKCVDSFGINTDSKIIQSLPIGTIPNNKVQNRFLDLALVSRSFDQNELLLVSTPLGLMPVVPPTISLLLKLCVIGLQNKTKHQDDLDFLRSKNVSLSDKELAILKARRREVEIRIKKARFFNKYKITRFVPHDQLHALVADQISLERPTFHKAVEGAEFSPQKFHKLSLFDRSMIVYEEIYVLWLERYVLPALTRHPELDVERIVRAVQDRIMDVENRYRKVSEAKPLQDHPDALAEFARTIPRIQNLYSEVKDKLYTEKELDIFYAVSKVRFQDFTPELRKICNLVHAGKMKPL
jgi:hypothetical protein